MPFCGRGKRPRSDAKGLWQWAERGTWERPVRATAMNDHVGHYR